MADRTKIEWTSTRNVDGTITPGATWNPITGCSVVSAGCKHCYAMKLAGTRLRNHPSREGLTIDKKAGPVWTGEVRLNEQWLDQPMRWNRPRRIFVCAHGDLFHESVPFDWIDRVFAVMSLCPQHTFQVLTKRAARMLEYMAYDQDIGRAGFIEGRARQIANIPLGKTLAASWPFPNVWLGVSAEDQEAADERIPLLRKTPAAVRFLSCEPLLSEINLHLGRNNDSGRWDSKGNPVPLRRIDWVIAGGESGIGARPMHPEWARSLRNQCGIAGVPFFFKQWGEWLPENQIHVNDEAPPHSEDRAVWSGPQIVAGSVCASILRVGKKAAGRLLDGREHSEFPAALDTAIRNTAG